MKFVILTIYFLLIPLTNLAPQIKIQKHLTSKDGLVNDRIQVIEQDKMGYLWIGTNDGLSRWDGTRFKNFHKYNGLTSSRIRDIAIDDNNILYIATAGGGLNIIENERISSITEENGLQTNFLLCVSILSNGQILLGGKGGSISQLLNGSISEMISAEKLNYKDVYRIFERSNGAIFIGTFQGGFFTYKDGELKNYNASDGMINENVYNFFENDDGSVYFSTNLGIHLFKDGKVKFQNNLWGLNESTCRTILCDKSGNTYFATAEGVFIHGHNKKELITLQNGLSFHELRSLFLDEFGTIYIGTYGNGIDIYFPDRLEIFNKSTGLPNEKVWAIYKSKTKKLYLGTHDGLSILSGKGTKTITMADYDYGNVVKRIIEAKDGKFYIGTTYGINVLSGETNRKLTKTDGLVDTYIMDLTETPRGKILASTRYGVVVIDNGKITSLTTSDGLADDYVISILASNDGTIYFGTNGHGISVYKNDKFSVLTKKDGLTDLTINVLAEDNLRNLYVGTDEGGLNIFKDGRISVIDINSGLSSNSIKGLKIADDGKVYATTDKGLNIIEFSDKNFKVKILNASAGLSSNLCLDKSILIDDDGYVWFGTASGLAKYNLAKDIDNKIPPRIYISNLKIYNQDIALEKFIKALDFSYDQNYLKFDFTGINLSAPDKITYMYMLSGVDESWIESKNNSVQYTNLGSSNYTFKVKAMNESGYWSEPAVLNFVINPPFWKTWWAYLIYFILVSIGFMTIRKYEMNRIKLRNELKQKEFESKKLQEVDTIKSTFFANISHEFRTPLTIILGSLEKLRSKMEYESDEKELAVMNRNAARLLQLINQLLELSRIESGNVKLQTTSGDIIKLLKRITATFSSLASQKNISLTFNSHPVDDVKIKEEIFISFDKRKLETVFYNILANAVKFSPNGARVEVWISKTEDEVKLEFLNTDTQIPTEKLNKIFDRFYQADDSETRNFEGTGIGLSLAKEYVEMHHGKIEVESANNKTIFSVYLPIEKSHLGKKEIYAEIDVAPTFVPDTVIFGEEFITDIEATESESTDIDKTRILLVEDNYDLRELVKESLTDDYQVLEAADGIKGLEIAEEKIPDLIISDIMMPGIDGNELSRKIKSNEKTNHIPIILLTAKATTKDKIEGLETGADDYLIKPFNVQELKIRIKNLIKIREQMREKFKSQMLIKPSDVILPSSQKIFIEKLSIIIESNISNESFSVETLHKELGMSRSQLHRKIKAVTNQTTTEFIRNFRLQRAAELIKQDVGNIAEITYMVGFSSQNYFTKMFQILYGKTPLEYKKQQTK